MYPGIASNVFFYLGFFCIAYCFVFMLFSIFLNIIFISKLLFLSYLNPCKIYLFKVAKLHCVVFFDTQKIKFKKCLNLRTMSARTQEFIYALLT